MRVGLTAKDAKENSQRNAKAVLLCALCAGLCVLCG